MFRLFRFPSQWHSDGPCHALIPGARLQCQRQLRPLQDYSGDMHLWQQRHLLLRPRSGAVTLQSTEAWAGQTAPAHLRNPVPDDQRPAAEVCPVSDFSPPHWSVAHCAETGRWDPVTELRDQPGPRWVWIRRFVCVCGHLSAPASTWIRILTVWWRISVPH